MILFNIHLNALLQFKHVPLKNRTYCKHIKKKNPHKHIHSFKNEFNALLQRIRVYSVHVHARV